MVQEALEMMWCDAGSYCVVVHAQHHRQVLVLGRRGDDHLLGSAVDVGLRLGGVGEDAGRLHHDVGADLTPWQRGRIALLEDPDRLAVDGDVVGGGDHVALQPAQDRVVLQQVAQARVVGQVVDGDHLDVCARGDRGAVEVAADPAETVDSNSYGHAAFSSGWCRTRASEPAHTLTNRPAPAFGCSVCGMRAIPLAHWALACTGYELFRFVEQIGAQAWPRCSGSRARTARLSAVANSRRIRPATASLVSCGLWS